LLNRSPRPTTIKPFGCRNFTPLCTKLACLSQSTPYTLVWSLGAYPNRAPDARVCYKPCLTSIPVDGRGKRSSLVHCFISDGGVKGFIVKLPRGQ
jgi:hypothetical protein